MDTTRPGGSRGPDTTGTEPDVPAESAARAAAAGSGARRVGIFHESAGAVVIVDDLCLVLRRGDEWVLPKGHLEANERPEDAAIREVREETGLDVRIVRPIGTTRYEFEGAGNVVAHRKRVHWFLAERLGGTLRPEPPFSEIAMIGRDRLDAVLTYESDRDLVERAFAAAGDEGLASAAGEDGAE